MYLALWDRPPADCLRQAAQAQGLLVECHDAAKCFKLLLEEQVDVALLPTTLALACNEAITVLPEAAVSAWSYPFARLVLRHGIRRVESVGFSADSAQEVLMARIVLQEHYGRCPAFVPRPREELPFASDDAALLIGSAVPDDKAFGTIFDIGQEWYELAQYPMVWGLFVTLADAATPEMVATVKALARAAETLAGAWPDRPEFYAESLRLRFDNIAVASLTRIREYLYYYNVTNELGELPMYIVEEEDENAPWWAAPLAGRPY